MTLWEQPHGQQSRFVDVVARLEQAHPARAGREPAVSGGEGHQHASACRIDRHVRPRRGVR